MQNLIRSLIFLFLMFSCGCAAIRDGFAFVQLTEQCGDRNFKHKSEAEIAAMSPEERMDQMVLEDLFHVPPFEDDNYRLLHQYLVQDGVKILPRAIEYANGYDPKASDCKARDEARLLTAAIYTDLVDTAKVRLRAIETGRVAIRALDQAIERRRAAEPDPDPSTRTRLLTTLLKGMKGRCIKDGLIQQTLKERYDVQMSDSELSAFTEYLIALDPAYPSWTKVIGWAELAPEEADRYYQAYLKFKAKK